MDPSCTLFYFFLLDNIVAPSLYEDRIQAEHIAIFLAIVLWIENNIILALFTLSSLNLPLPSSFTTSRELLSQFSTCSV